jgi:hypothetical protein
LEEKGMKALHHAIARIDAWSRSMQATCTEAWQGFLTRHPELEQRLDRLGHQGQRGLDRAHDVVVSACRCVENQVAHGSEQPQRPVEPRPSTERKSHD